MVCDENWKVGKMKFIRDLLGKRRPDERSRQAQGIESLEQSYRETIGSIVNETEAAKATLAAGTAASDVLTGRQPADVRVVEAGPTAAPAAKAPAVNIWDMEDDGSATELPASAPSLDAATPQEARSESGLSSEP